MGQVNQESNLVNRVVRLEQQLESIRKLAGATSVIISRGGLTLLNDSFIKMVDDNNNLILYSGPDDLGRQVFELRRENGQLIMRSFFLGSGDQIWALYDRGGRIVVSEDGLSGVGMAEPWIPVPVYIKAYPSAFLDSLNTDLTVPVSACTGGAIWEGRIGKVSHPKIQYDGVFGRVLGTSGSPTYTFKLNGVIYDSFTQTGYGATLRGPFDITSLIGSLNVIVRLEVSATGTGTDRIAAQPNAVYLRQS